jgi:hypothetical protein
MKKVLAVFFLFLALLMTGCASKVSSTAVPGASLKEKGTFYVVRFEPDKRNLNMIIANQLTSMGFNAAAGEKSDIPEDVDTVVTYVDQWQWDMSNYMIKIDIQFRDAKDGALIMSGNSFRTSLVRRTPETMIKETLEEMLKSTKSE